MSLQRIAPPDASPISLADLKVHLRIEADVTDEDTLLQSMLDTAVEEAEHRTGRALMPQQWALNLEAFSASTCLSMAPVSGVDSITYLDDSGVRQTLSPSLYQLDPVSEYTFQCITPAYGTAWPSARRQSGSVCITFSAGYATADLVPAGIKSWLLLQVSAMYENREAEGAVQTHVLGFADRLLDRAKVWGT